MEKKLKVLKKMATILNNNDITWNVGASCMLYLRGLVPHFNDIDIMISLEDIETVKDLFKDFDSTVREPNEQYKTKHFIEYIVDGIDIDVMAGFIIVNDNKDYAFPLEKGRKQHQYDLEGTSVNLATVEEWLYYYTLMERKDKIELLK